MDNKISKSELFKQLKDLELQLNDLKEASLDDVLSAISDLNAKVDSLINAEAAEGEEVETNADEDNASNNPDLEPPDIEEPLEGEAAAVYPHNPEVKLAPADVITKKNLNLKEVDGHVEKFVSFAITKSDVQPTEEVDPESYYYPTVEQLAMINANHSKTPLKKEQVRVFEASAANSAVDRGFENFTQKALEEMASLAIKNKIPFLIGQNHDHEWAIRSVNGVVFDAKVEDGNLLYSFYIPVINKTKDVLEAIMTGLYNKLSVGFAFDPEQYKCSMCMKSMFYASCSHYPGMIDGKTGSLITASIDGVVDNFEFSGVAVPMQQEAAIRKNSLDLKSTTIAKTINGNTTLTSESIVPVQVDGEQIQNLDNDKIINDTTIEDLKSMSDVTTQPVENQEPVVETAPVVVDEKTNTATVITTDEPQPIDNTGPADVPKLAKSHDEVLSTISSGVEKLIELAEKTAKHFEVSNAQAEQILTLTANVDKLQKTVDAALQGSLKSILEYAFEDEVVEAPVSQDKNWVKATFSDAFIKTDDLGGQS